MRRTLTTACALTLAISACKARDERGEFVLPPTVNASPQIVSWTPQQHERALCPWTQIRFQSTGQPTREYLCLLVSHAWAVLDTNAKLRPFASTDSAGRPRFADVDCARMDSPDIPKEQRSVRWVIEFPSTHADSAGISVGVDSTSGTTQVYRHVPFLKTPRRSHT